MNIDLKELVQFLGYPGLFAAVFAETGIFFMFFLPGSSMLFTAGLLASHGIFNVWILLPLITAAAILGDNTGYWFGNRVGQSLWQRDDSRFFKKKYLEQTHEFYEKHGVYAIVLARFVPMIRTFAPIVAGITRMRYGHFLSLNIIGGILWGSGVTFAGYFLGEKVPFIDKYLSIIIIAIIVASIIPLFTELIKSKYRSANGSQSANKS